MAHQQALPGPVKQSVSAPADQPATDPGEGVDKSLTAQDKILHTRMLELENEATRLHAAVAVGHTGKIRSLGSFYEPDPPSCSEAIPALLASHDVLVSGYSEGTRMKMGDSVIAGTKTIVRFLHGPSGIAQVIIQHLFVNFKRQNALATIVVPAVKLLESTSVTHIDSDSSEVRQVLDLTHGLKISAAMRVRLQVERKDVIFNLPVRRWPELDGACLQAAKSLAGFLDHSVMNIDLYMLRDDTLTLDSLRPLFEARQQPNKVDVFFTKLHQLDYLTRHNVSTTYNRPKKLNPAVAAFQDSEQRMAVMQVSSMEEFDYDMTRAAALKKYVWRCWVAAMPNSRLGLSKDESLARYGCEVHPDTHTQYLTVVEVPKSNRNLLPDIGQAVCMNLGGSDTNVFRITQRSIHKSREAPGCRAARVARALFKRLLRHETDIAHRREVARLQIEGIEQSDTSDEARRLGKAKIKDKLEISEDHSARSIIDTIALVVVRASSKAEALAPNYPTLARVITAAQMAPFFSRGPNESNNAWTDRLTNLCLEIGADFYEEGDELEDNCWRGRRINAPRGIRATPYVFFSVTRARQSHWCPDFEKPPIDCTLSSPPFAGTTKDFIATLTQPAYELAARIMTEPNDATCIAEMDAVNRAASALPGSLLAA